MIPIVSDTPYTYPTMERQYVPVCELSNGAIFNDLELNPT